MCPLFALVCLSDTSSCVHFVGDGKQREGESDRYERDERKEGNHIGNALESTAKNTAEVSGF